MPNHTYRGCTFLLRRHALTRKIKLSVVFPGYTKEEAQKVGKNFSTPAEAISQGERIVDYTYLIAAQQLEQQKEHGA